MNSRSKGARGEREAAQAWRKTMGGTARRGQQFSGGSESPDIIIRQKNIHVEVKRVEAGNPYVWLAQATRDAGQKVPVVLHRRNNKPWLLILELENVQRFLLAAQDTQPIDGMGEEGVPADLPG